MYHHLGQGRCNDSLLAPDPELMAVTDASDNDHACQGASEDKQRGAIVPSLYSLCSKALKVP